MRPCETVLRLAHPEGISLKSHYAQGVLRTPNLDMRL